MLSFITLKSSSRPFSLSEACNFQEFLDPVAVMQKCTTNKTWHLIFPLEEIDDSSLALVVWHNMFISSMILSSQNINGLGSI